jgi:hypothetical protein
MKNLIMKKITIKLLCGFVLLLSTTIQAQTNDDCANAIVLNCGDVLVGEATDLATGGTGTSCIGTIGNDLWYIEDAIKNNIHKLAPANTSLYKINWI